MATLKKVQYLLVSSQPEASGWHKRGQAFRSLFMFLMAGYLFFTILNPAWAGNVSFDDSHWQSFDCDGDDDTAFTVNSASSMSITAAGIDVWTGSDQYGAYYLEDIDGDFEATVKITAQTWTNSWAKAGIMVRNVMDLNGDNHNGYGYVMMSVTPDNGFAFQWDNNDNGFLDSNQNTGGTSTYPVWLKLKKETSTSTYTGYYSYDGLNWTQAGSKTFGSIDSIQDVGLFVTSHYDRHESTVDFESFTIDNGPIPTTYTITPWAGNNGNITPSSAVTVSEGDSLTFTVAPDTGYEVDTFLVDGGAATLTNNQYTFLSVVQNHTISVTFTDLTYNITASYGQNGRMSPSGIVSVGSGQSQTFTVTPDSGYEVDTFHVDGSSASLINDAYTFSGVTAAHTISVTFKASSGSGSVGGIPGCATNTYDDYSGGFDIADFDFQNIEVDSGVIKLQTGVSAIDPESIIVPFEQDVTVTFLYEGAGYVSDFGWMLKSDAVDSSGNFLGWNSIPQSAKHPIFRNIYDDNETAAVSGCCGGGDGVLDSEYGNGSFPTSSETALSTYNDGTGYPFIVDGDGSVTPKDMKKNLGTFAAGTEIVFFLTADKDWTTSDTNSVFFTKKDWNQDTYGACGTGTFNKVYDLGTATTEGSCVTSGGWLTQPAIDRLNNIFGVTLSGSYNLPVTVGQKFSHVIVGAPDNDPDQWILGWEDLAGGGDADHNDMVFRIERRTGGVAQLKSAEAIVPVDANAYFTAVNFEVWDSMPCNGSTQIDYYVSIDGGGTWVEISEWDQIFESDSSKSIIGSGVTDWSYGDPQYTYRSRRIDFAGRGLTGRALIWKAEIFSDDVNCIPSILDVALAGNVASNGNFSRSSPIILTNVNYSGYYETPAMDWSEKVQRGHLSATRIYDPADPSQTDEMLIWEAGSILNSVSPDNRTIYYPHITVTNVTSEAIGTGDSSGTTTFSGTLAHAPISATTVRITDQTETFTDIHTDELTGNRGGTGTINRFTGDYTINFNTPPGDGVGITADYTYYAASGVSEFTTTNITSDMLGLDDTYIVPDGFKYDFNNDDKYNNVAHDGSGTADDSDADWLVEWVRGWTDGTTKAQQKEWLLGPIDHSTPAVLTPPGKPEWYYGSDILLTERAAYDTFRQTYSQRQTVIFVGSRDGMLHAFDGGKFRWGDNPDTGSISEMRGYFLWEGSPKQPNYGTGAELWAFIPANLLSRLKNNLLSGEDQAYIDASPTLADVYVNSDWKTVLLCAQGNGGDTIFCLDVTDPINPDFMWEFSDPDLFRSRSSPSIGKIGRIVDKNGDIKWVAFFVSGKTYDTSLYPSIYMINIADGSVVERIYLDVEANGVGGVPSGQPSIVDSDENGYIDRIYIGTDKGYLYKVNIPDDPYNEGTMSQCVINTDFDTDGGDVVPVSQRYHPIYASPTVYVEKILSGIGQLRTRVRVFFGTGDSPYYDEDINTSTTTYHFFAYIDECGKGECDSSKLSLDWIYELPAGHRVFASAFAAAGTVYFGTSTAETEDPCETSNEGQIIALNADDGSTVFSQQVGNIVTPVVVEDKHLYLRTPYGAASYGGGTYNNELIMGGDTTISTRMWREVF